MPVEAIQSLVWNQKVLREPCEERLQQKNSSDGVTNCSSCNEATTVASKLTECSRLVP